MGAEIELHKRPKPRAGLANASSLIIVNHRPIRKTKEHMNSKVFGALLVMLVLSGCGVTSNIASGTRVPLGENSGVLLLGVKPAYRIQIVRSDVSSGAWIHPFADVPEVNLAPDANGYIFVKVKPTAPNERLGISVIFPEGQPYGPCEGAVWPTFEIKAGSINYVGELLFNYDGKNLTYSYGLDEARARQYMASKFPNDAEKLTVIPMVPMLIHTNVCKD